MSKQLDRRTFLKVSAAGALAGMPTAVRTARQAKAVHGANEAINMGFIGLNARGAHLVNWFREIPGVRIAALCDPDREVLEREQQRCAEHDETPKTFVDLRALLDDPDIDAVALAMPNQWHVLAGIWACQAGKDVFIEKPVSHNIWEGRQLVKAARKYGRIMQGGTQQRSCPVLPALRTFLVEEEQLGRIQYVRSSTYNLGSEGYPRYLGARVNTPLAVPEHVDYNLWCGPAPDDPPMRRRLHYEWHWQWAYGTGELGNWGTHVLDDVLYILGIDTLPKRCVSGGGRFVWDDNGETPNVAFVYYDTGDVPVMYDVSNLPLEEGSSEARSYRGLRTGSVFQCENGFYVGGRRGGRAFDNDRNVIRTFEGDGGNEHAANFIAALRARDATLLNAEVEHTHISTAWCHLGNISCRLGGAYSREEARERADGFEPWSALVAGVEEHLAGHDVDLSTVALGPVLDIDPATETFVGPNATPEALALLRREYREPFVVPEEV